MFGDTFRKSRRIIHRKKTKIDAQIDTRTAVLCAALHSNSKRVSGGSFAFMY